MGIETESEYGGSEMSFMSAILVIEGNSYHSLILRTVLIQTFYLVRIGQSRSSC